MSAQKSTLLYAMCSIIILIAFLLGYQLGKTNTSIKATELNPDFLKLLTRRSDLPLKDIDLFRSTYDDTSYSPYDSETQIRDFAYVEFSGTYLPTKAQFSLHHGINIYEPGHVPSITATQILYNDAIAHKGDVKLLALSEMDKKSWGFCYTQSETCYIESKYNGLVSQIGIVITGADEKQRSEILGRIISAFYKRVRASAIQYE